MTRSATVERSTPDESVSERVITAVAEKTGADPCSIEPLYHAVDSDALDRFFETGPDRAPRRVSFTYCGCDVVVSGDGTVRVSTNDDNT